jgi:hypothetical protein
MAIMVAFFSIVSFSCDDEKETNDIALAPDGLRYATVTEVYEGKSMESAKPVVFSDSQPIFEIVKGSAEDGGTYIEDTFTIKDSTGIISLAKNNKLLAGLYKLDIKVSNKAGEKTFPGIFELRILPSAIEGLKYAPYTQTIVRGLADSKTSAPEFKGSKPVTFELFTKEGEKDYGFVIDANTGEISLPTDSGLKAGKYKLSVKTKNAGGESEFEKVVEIDLETKAYNLKYTPKEYLDVQQKQAKSSAAPTVEGTGPFTYSLKDDKGAFTIEPNSGVISLPLDHSLAIDTYNLTVVVTNAHGSVEFADAVSFEIVAIKAVLPSDLTYSTNAYTVNQGSAFVSVTPTIIGSTPITYALVDDKGTFAIDANTGVISLTDGHTLAEDDYKLSVKATNVKGEVTFDDIVTVTIRIPVPEIVFEDGWDDLTPKVGEKQLGNMIEQSLIGDPVQAASNKKWTKGWGNWGVKDENGNDGRGASMIPDKAENDDWLIAKNVDLTDFYDTKLNLAGYAKWGAHSSTLKLMISEDYSDDVATANWAEVSFERFDIAKKSELREIDLSAFDGKRITIALRHESRVTAEFPEAELKTGHFIGEFRVMAIRK